MQIRLTGQVRIGCAEIIYGGTAAGHYRTIVARYPKIAVHADYAEHVTTDFRELRERNVDLVFGRVSEPFPHDDLHVESLYEEEYFVVASSRNRWARRRKITLAELTNEPWIHMPPNNVISSLMADAFHRQGLEVPQEAVASLSMHLRTHLLAGGKFLTIMPNTMYQFNAERWALKALPIDLGIRARQVAIITLKHRTLNPVVQLFLEQARAVANSIQRRTRSAKKN